MIEPPARSRTEPVEAPSGINRFAARGHHRLAYEFVPAVVPDAPVVLFLHGLLAGRGEWALQRHALTGRFTLILPEARGHGASAALTDKRYSLADLVAETTTVLDHASAADAHVIGHGLGGATAWELAATAPERVRSLTLIEPELPALLDDLDPRAGLLRRETRQTDQAAADAADKGLTDKALDTYFAPRRGADWRDRVSRPEQAAFRRHAPSLAGMLSALDAHEPTGDSRTWPGPALVVRSALPRPIVDAIDRRLAAHLPGARRETVPTASPFDSPLAGDAGVMLGELLWTFLIAQAPS